MDKKGSSVTSVFSGWVICEKLGSVRTVLEGKVLEMVGPRGSKQGHKNVTKYSRGGDRMTDEVSKRERQDDRTRSHEEFLV